MIFVTFIFLSATLFLLLTRDISLNIKKNDQLCFRFAFLHFNFDFKRKKKRKKKSKQKSSITPNYFKLIQKNSKLLQKTTIVISKITLPCNEKDFTVDSFLLPYKKYALISSIISFLDSKVKNLEIKRDAVSISQSASSLCLDITIKTELFHLLPFIFAHLFLSIKNRIKGRKKRNVRE